MIRAIAFCGLMLSSIVGLPSATLGQTSARVERVGLFSRAPSPVYRGVSDRASLAPLVATKQAALRERDGFLVQDGFVFYVGVDGAPKFVTDSSDVREIVMFKGKLIALDKKGDVYILTEGDGPGTGEWYQLGNSTVDLATDDVDLFALTSSKAFWTGKITRGVWVYKGQPGEMEWTYIPLMIPMPCGNSTCFTTILIPTPAGREVAFEDANVPGAVRLAREGNRVVATTDGGATVVVSRSIARP